MTVSGYHNNDPMIYMETAINRVKLSGKLTPIVAYCFHMQCEFNPIIHNAVVANLPDHAKVLSEMTSSALQANRKKKARPSLDLSDEFKEVGQFMNSFNSQIADANKIQKSNAEIKYLKLEMSGLTETITDLKHQVRAKIVSYEQMQLDIVRCHDEKLTQKYEAFASNKKAEIDELKEQISALEQEKREFMKKKATSLSCRQVSAADKENYQVISQNGDDDDDGSLHNNDDWSHRTQMILQMKEEEPMKATLLQNNKTNDQEIDEWT